MATETFGEYSGYTTPGGVRFRKDNKLVSEAVIPPNVASLLKSKLLGGERGVVENIPNATLPSEKKFPMPSEAEKQRLRAESLQIKPELQATPEKLIQDAAALTQDDFDEQPELTPEAERVVEQMEQAPLLGVTPAQTPDVDSDFLESVSIYTAPRDSLVQALYDRFGVYTVYLGQLPVADEINPLTGEGFSKYHLGIAYQAAIRAENTGVLDRPAEEGRKTIDQGREASSNYQNQFEPQARTFGEARSQNSFAYRTSVRGMNESTEGNPNGATQHHDNDEDEMIVEPQFGKQIIRPDW